MIGQFFETMIIVLSDKRVVIYYQSKLNCWKRF